MTLSPLLFLIVCPLTGLAGFVDAVAGGGGLISLPAYMIAGLPVHAAIGTNKLSSGMGTALATGRLAKGGNIPWRQAGLCIAAALIGSWAGARLALLVDPEVFKRLMLVILPLTALYLLRSRPLGDGAGDLPKRTMTLRAALIALGVGVYDGFYGPGTGTFLLLLLTGFAHFKLGEANGVAKSINLTTNLTALVVYLVNGKVLIPLGLAAGACSIVGNYIGISFFHKKGSRAVKPIMLGVLALFFVKVLWEILQG